MLRLDFCDRVYLRFCAVLGRQVSVGACFHVHDTALNIVKWVAIRTLSAFHAWNWHSESCHEIERFTLDKLLILANCREVSSKLPKLPRVGCSLGVVWPEKVAIGAVISEAGGSEYASSGETSREEFASSLSDLFEGSVGSLLSIALSAAKRAAKKGSGC